MPSLKDLQEYMAEVSHIRAKYNISDVDFYTLTILVWAEIGLLTYEGFKHTLLSRYAKS